jgi:hypothetical protein
MSRKVTENVDDVVLTPYATNALQYENDSREENEELPVKLWPAHAAFERNGNICVQ